MASNNASLFMLSFLVLNVFLFHGMNSAQLSPTFYLKSCPKALFIIKDAIEDAVKKEARMGASLLRLHFHDCFVQGCDASILLNDTPTFTGEQTAFPNINSIRGLDVIDNIKDQLEKECPGVVSCADIIAVAAKESVVALDGPSWRVLLGRRDSTTASQSGANNNLPGPFLNLSEITSSFSNQGLTQREMVALSGAHTIGQAKCFLFKSRIYNENNIDPSYAKSLQANCPQIGGDNNQAPLDTSTPMKFDNFYYKNLLIKKGLLHSDQELFNGGPTDSIVQTYASDRLMFFKDFGNAMEKMSNLGPLTGTKGEIRKNCRKIN